MPFGPGTYGPGGTGQMAGPAEVLQGGTPAPLNTDQALSELVLMLKSGQAGAEKLMGLLAMLAQSAAPQMDAPQGDQQGPPSIQGLLG